MIIWITGASSGIGRATALEAAHHGDGLILTARRIEALESLAEECRAEGASSVSLLPYDLSHTEGLASLADEAWALAPNGGIDVAFLNAGISQRTDVLDTDEAMLRRIMELNWFSPVLLAKALLPRMLERGHGRFAVTTSINGRFGFPLRCGYSSSKHALYGFFETLRAEYSSRGISVTIICPGRVQSDISLHALEKGGREHGRMDPGQANGLDTRKAAKRIYRAIRRGSQEALIGGGELAMVWIKRFFPRLCSYISAHVKQM